MPTRSDYLKDVDQQLFNKVMQLTNQISTQENHFNDLESNYRKLASTWLLAALGACGYILNSSSHISVDKWAIIASICISASIGIGVLWILDLDVYHRLLNCYFVQGLWLESQYPEWLYPVRIEMLLSQSAKDVSARVRYYYLISVLLPLLISIFAIWNIRIPNDALAIKLLLTTIIILVVVAIFLGHMRRRRKSEQGFRDSEIGKIVANFKSEIRPLA